VQDGAPATSLTLHSSSPTAVQLPTEGYSSLKNLTTRLLLVIIALAIGSAIAVWKLPMRKGLDIQGGMRVVLRAQTEKLPKGVTWDDSKLEVVTDVLRRRVDSLGVSEPQIYPVLGQARIVVELPGVKNKEQALDIIKSTAKLDFRYVPQLDNNTWTTRPTTGPGGDRGEFEDVINTATGKPVSYEQIEAQTQLILDGAQLKPNSYVDIPQGKPVIHFEFQDQAKNTFEDFTRGHIGKRLAVFLDNKLITAPNINDVIPGIGIIEGSFTAESAKTLANQLNAGALPVPLEQLQLTNVEATLGAQAVRQTFVAGMVGLGLVMVFMLFWYRVPGLLADLALLLYALFSLAVFKGGLQFLGVPPVTLTIPGIAGFILSIGMAVDANILIFERMKEERNSGKTLRASIEAGFKRAITAIVDSNVCTLITCGILWWFGTGQVRGFALTLAIGVVISLFTAVTVSRTFLLLFANSTTGQNDNLYGLHGGFHPKLGVTKRMGMWFGISGLIIVPGLIAIAMGGIKPSIEFTGGTEISAQFDRPVTSAQIASALASVGHKESRILLAEGNRAYITTKSLDTAEKARVESALTPIGGHADGDSSVSGTISKELTRNAILAVLYASGMIILYLAIRFSIPNFVEGLKFGTCAVVALLHDVLVLLGLFAVFGYLFNWQVDSLFVTAMLTVIGFSVHDTIIIFDRMRENLQHRQRGETFAEVADRSIEQTFARSVYTSFTVVLTLLALLLFGGPTVKLFVAALLIGIISGTYSSIFNATPLLVLWRRLSGGDTLAAAPATAGPGTTRVSPRPQARRVDPSSRPRPAATPRVTTPVAETSANGIGIDNDLADTLEASGGSAAGRLQPRKKKRRQ
jgi:SecD/SecF fusion protein